MNQQPKIGQKAFFEQFQKENLISKLSTGRSKEKIKHRKHLLNKLKKGKSTEPAKYKEEINLLNKLKEKMS